MKWPSLLSLSIFALLAFAAIGDAATYDPLALPDKHPSTAPTVDLTVHDATRNRDIPVRVFWPAPAIVKEGSGTAALLSPEPVVLFSHGLGGSREGSAFLGEHWASRGYVTVYVQHPGSDAAVWKGVEPAERMAALKRGVGAESHPACAGHLPKKQRGGESLAQRRRPAQRAGEGRSLAEEVSSLREPRRRLGQ